MPEGMTYIVQRNDRFYVVAYDGLDPLTGKERRRWHPRCAARVLWAAFGTARLSHPDDEYPSIWREGGCRADQEPAAQIR
jgi:hypothetical protein